MESALSDNPGYSSILYPYQHRYLTDNSRFKAAAFCRQGGKTFTTTLECVLDCMEAEAAGRVCKWTIFSISRDRAKDAMDDGVKLHLKAFAMAFEELEIPAPDIEETVYEVRLPGGSRIRCVAATENTCRGISENVMLDEYGRMPNSYKIWAAIFPIVSRSGLKLRVISTFNGLTGKFYDIMFSPAMAKVFSRHIVDIVTAVNDGLPRNIEELKAGLNDPDAWEQEYMCRPVDAATAWLTYELINACEDPTAGIPSRYRGGYCYLGVDFGRVRNLTTMYLYEDVESVLKLRERRELERERWQVQKDHMTELFESYNIVRSAMDATGMGSEPVEWAQEKFGLHRVEAVWFTASAKLDIGTRLKEKMEDRAIRNPRCQLLKDDLHSVRRVVGPTGIPRLVAPTTGVSHADRFWACGLAVAAAAQGEGPDLSKIRTTSHLEKSNSNLFLPDGRGGWGRAHKGDKYRGY